MHVKYKIFLSAMEYLPFSMEDDSKGSFEEIIERYSKVSKPCHFFFKNSESIHANYVVTIL